MKIGDYVRTKSYGIRKIEGFSISLTEDFINCDYDEYQNVLINKKDIIKSSQNIIDLIEVGDYVNGDKIISIGKDRNDEKIIYYEIPSDYGEDYYKNSEIKSIVTKEQFERMEYRI